MNVELRARISESKQANTLRPMWARWLRAVLDMLKRVFNWPGFCFRTKGERCNKTNAELLSRCRLTVGDTADCQSALRKTRALPVIFSVTTLISRGLEEKRAFSASFLTLNHLDFS